MWEEMGRKIIMTPTNNLLQKKNHNSLTCIFHVLGRWVCFWLAAAIPAFACFVCCIIWLMRSSCCLVRPSFPAPAGELGDDGFEPSPPLYWMHVAPCGELASPRKYIFHILTNQFFFFLLNCIKTYDVM